MLRGQWRRRAVGPWPLRSVTATDLLTGEILRPGSCPGSVAPTVWRGSTQRIGRLRAVLRGAQRDWAARPWDRHVPAASPDGGRARPHRPASCCGARLQRRCVVAVPRRPPCCPWAADTKTKHWAPIKCRSRVIASPPTGLQNTGQPRAVAGRSPVPPPARAARARAVSLGTALSADVPGPLSGLLRHDRGGHGHLACRGEAGEEADACFGRGARSRRRPGRLLKTLAVLPRWRGLDILAPFTAPG